MSSLLYLERKDLVAARRDVDYLTDARAALVLDANPLAGLSLLLVLVVLAAGYMWADHAVLDEVTVGQGKIVPLSHEQLIQSLEGGILAELLVREGDIVEQNQVLLRIDDTRFDATMMEGQHKAQALQSSIARLVAEATGSQPNFPAGIGKDIIESERKLFNSRRKALSEAMTSLGRNLQLVEEELAMTEPLVSSGAVSEVEVLRLRRQVIELRGKIEERRNIFRADARSELSLKEAELAGVLELNKARADQVRRAVIRAPMRGTVKNIKVTTVGGVIGPGQEIMEIVPLEDQLLIEARIRPADVAFLRPGQPVTVKISAYDYSIYGGLHGELTHISADTIRDEKNPQESYYRILVRTDKAHLDGKDGPLPIIAGMVGSVEVLTGHKTVLEYLLKPILKTRDNALRER